MSEKIILPNDFLSLAEEDLRNGKKVKILADGASMYPFIIGGKDMTEISPLSSDNKLIKWNVYFFNHKGHYIIHRLIDKNGNRLTMMGDGNIKIKEIIRREDIIGILTSIYSHRGKTIDCTSTSWRGKGRIWWMLRPLRRYLLAVIRRLNRLLYN